MIKTGEQWQEEKLAKWQLQHLNANKQTKKASFTQIRFEMFIL